VDPPTALLDMTDNIMTGLTYATFYSFDYLNYSYIYLYINGFLRGIY